MDPYYKNLIWTKHALERMRKRGIKQSDAWATWQKPDKSRYAKTRSAWIYHKDIHGKKIEVVTKKNEKGEWVIISVWSKPVHSKRIKKKDSSVIELIKRCLRFVK